MEGNQEVITLVSNLHGVAIRFYKTDFTVRVNLKSRWRPCALNLYLRYFVFCTFEGFRSLLPKHCRITVCRSGSAQPGSERMLSFLRLCHAVWVGEDIWVYFTTSEQFYTSTFCTTPRMICLRCSPFFRTSLCCLSEEYAVQYCL